MVVYDPRFLAAQQALAARKLAPSVFTYDPRTFTQPSPPAPAARSVSAVPAGSALARLGASVAATAPSGAATTPGGGGSFGSSIIKGVLKPLELLAGPGRAVVSTVREGVDLLDTDPNTKASFGDWWDQTKDPSFGFGTAFPMEGWGGRIAGFIGDVALDPLTYVTLGTAKAGQFAGRVGREALAARALQAGRQAGLADDAVEELVQKAGRYGLGALDETDRALIGVERSGVRFMGKRIPGTSEFAERVGQGLASTRAAARGAIPVLQSDRVLTRGLQPWQRKLLTGDGSMSATQSAAVLAATRRAAARAKAVGNELGPEAESLIRTIGGRRADWRTIRKLVEQGSDDPRAQAFRDFGDRMFARINDELVALGEQPVKYLGGWAPRVWTAEGRSWISGDSPLAQALRRGAGVSGRQGDIEFERVLRPGTVIEVNGAEVVLDGTTDQINQLARSEGVKQAISDDLVESLNYAVRQASKAVEGARFRSQLREWGVAAPKFLDDATDGVIDPETRRVLNDALLVDAVDVKATRANKKAAQQAQKEQIDRFVGFVKRMRAERRTAAGDLRTGSRDVKRQVRNKLNARLGNAQIARTTAGKRVVEAVRAWEADDLAYGRLIESLDRQIAQAEKVASRGGPAAVKAQAAVEVLQQTKDDVVAAADEIMGVSPVSAVDEVAVPSVAPDVPETAMVDDVAPDPVVADTGVADRVGTLVREANDLERQRAAAQDELARVKSALSRQSGRSAADKANADRVVREAAEIEDAAQRAVADKDAFDELSAKYQQALEFEDEMARLENPSSNDLVEFKTARLREQDQMHDGLRSELLRLGGSGAGIDERTGNPVFHLSPKNTPEWDWWRGLAPKEQQRISRMYFRSTKATRSTGRTSTPIDVFASEFGVTVDEWAESFLRTLRSFEEVRASRAALRRMNQTDLRDMYLESLRREMAQFEPEYPSSYYEKIFVRMDEIENGVPARTINPDVETGTLFADDAVPLVNVTEIEDRIAQLDQAIAAKNAELVFARWEREIASLPGDRPVSAVPDPVAPVADEVVAPATVAPTDPTPPIEQVVQQVARRTPRQERASELVADLASDRADIASEWDVMSGRNAANVGTLRERQAAAEQRLAEVADTVGVDKERLQQLGRTQNVSEQQIAADITEMAGLLDDAEVGPQLRLLVGDLSEKADRIAVLDNRIDRTNAMITKLRNKPAKFAAVYKKVWMDGWEELASTGTMIPTEVADALRYVDELSKPAVANKFWRMVDGYTTFFKSWALATPGFHLRNAMSATAMNFVAGADFDAMAKGLRYWRMYMRDHQNWWKGIGDPEEQRAARAALEAVFGSGAGQYDELQTVWSSRLGPPWGRLSQRAGREVEGAIRMGLALDTMRQAGTTVDDAIARVSRYHFNYGETSMFDEGMKRLVPFWTFTSRNLPLQVQEMWMRPRVYLTYEKFVNNMRQDQEGDVIPVGLQEMGAFIAQRGDGAKGEGSWLLAPDLPWSRLEQEISKFTDPKRFLSNATPLLRVPLETTVVNRRLYNDVPFKQDGLVEGSWTQRLFGPVLDVLGLQQTAGDGSRVVDERIPYAFESLWPFLGQGERLVPTQEYFGDRKLQSYLNWTGVPAKQLTSGAIEAEERRREYERRALESRLRALMEYGRE